MYYEDKNYKKRRILLILGIIIFLILLIAFIYLFFQKEDNTNIEENTESTNIINKLLPSFGNKEKNEGTTINNNDNLLPSNNEENLVNQEEIENNTNSLINIPERELEAEKAKTNSSIQLIENISTDLNKAVSHNSDSNTVRFYDYDKNQFFKINEYGEIESLSDKKFYKVQDITWSPVDDKAILTYADGKNLFYDFQTGKQYSLNENWSDFDFSPDGKNIAFKENSVQADYRWLSVANPDGSEKRLVKHLGINADKVTVKWDPNKQIIAEYPVIDNLSRSKLYFIGENDENFQAIYVDGSDVRTEWSPEGTTLLASAYSPESNFNPQLEIINFDPINHEAISKKTINLQTWADKCIYKDENNIICAVPQNMVEGAGMQPDVMKYSVDDLYNIDVKTGATKKIMENQQSYTISNLTLAEDGNLYFIDSNTGTLQKVYLK